MSNRTTIIIAHRLSTIQDVDTIIVLKNGQVVESGNHSELMSKSGEYAALVKLQVSDQVNDSSIESPSGSSRYSSFREPFSLQNNLQYSKSFRESETLSTNKGLNPASSSPSPSIWELLKLNAPEWPYAVLGSLGAILAGIQAPLFALGITHVLSAFYSPHHSQIKEEVQHVAFVFIGVAILTIPIYLLQHYFYTLMGERLTARVRLLLFSGFFIFPA